jgi:membrane-bound lytic murein transglycosylase MltF
MAYERGLAMKMSSQWSIWLLLACAMPMPASQAFAAAHDGDDASAVIYRMTQQYKEDVSPKTRGIRVLVHYSRTKFFVANGVARGFEHDLMKEFEAHYNKGRTKRETKIPVIFIPVRFEELIPKLLEGRGDVAAGLMTITDDRAKRVKFTLPYIRNVAEVVIAHTGAPPVKDVKDLAGRKVHVLRGSSFAGRLKNFNRRQGFFDRSIEVVEMPPGASTEDLLEMVNAGIFQYTVADDFMGDLWTKVLPGLRVTDARLSEANDIAWAVRPGNPKLLAALNDFIDEGKDRLPKRAAELHQRYFQNVRLLRNNLDADIVGRKKDLAPYFQGSGKRYSFDWLFMMAQGFQESGLNQSARSPMGAVGVMQLLPSTAKDMGHHDVDVNAQSNIEAGAKYMRFLIDRYFNQPGLPAAVRFDFALAAYNAGPGRIQQMRKLAKERGLDPDRWFHNVERVTLEKVGEEPVQYVANIHRYYTAYKLSGELQSELDAMQQDTRKKTVGWK